MSQTLTFLFAFIAVLALIGVAAWLVRRFATNRLGANTNRGRMPRLAVIDAAAVDGRRRLVLVRRDNVEHLLMIGGPSDIVVEPNIVRAMPARDQMAPRPAVGEQPPRIAPLPDAAWNDAKRQGRTPDLPMPSIMPNRKCPSRRRGPRVPPLPTKSAARRRRSDAAIPSTGFAPESIGGRPRRTAPSRRPDPSARLTRTEPLMPRPPRPSEPPKVPPPIRAAERAAAPPPPPPPPPSPPPAQSRRPKSRRDGATAGSRPAPPGRRNGCAAGRARTAACPPVAQRAPARHPPLPPPQKSGFENLEDEMASLLGRPKTPS